MPSWTQRAVAVLVVAALFALLWPGLPPRATAAAASAGIIRGGEADPVVFDPTLRPGAVPEFASTPTAFLRSLVALPYGGLHLTFVDALIPNDVQPLIIRRDYHSASHNSGVFGAGWNSNLDERLLLADLQAPQLVEPDGRITLYQSDGGNRYKPVIASFVGQTLQANADGTFVRRWSDGVEERFDHAGRLLFWGDQSASASYAYEAATDVHPSSVRDADGHVVRFSYIGALLTQLTDSLGRTTTFGYNDGTLTRTTDALGRTVTFAYGPSGMRHMTLPEGRAVDFSYRPDGTLSAAAGPGYLRARYAWLRDVAAGTLTLQTQIGARTEALVLSPGVSGSAPGMASQHIGGPSAAQTGIVTDDRIAVSNALGQPMFGIGSDGTIATPPNAPSAADETPDEWRAEVTPATIRNGDQSVRYDAAGRPIEIALPDGTHERWTWDNGDRLVQAVDTAGATVSYDYDSLNQLAGVHRVGQSVQYTHDATGLLTRQVGDDLEPMRWEYDDGGNVVRIDTEAGSIGLTYDDAGRLTSLVGPAETRTFAYDAYGRVTQATTGTLAVNYTYDALGRLGAATTSNGASTTYAYGSNSTVATVTGDGTPIAAIRIDANGKLIAASTPSGNYAATYAPDGRLLDYTETDGTKTTLGYDTAGRIVKQASPAGTLSYAYDATGRLIAVDNGSRHTAVRYAANGTKTVTTTDPTGSSSITYDSLGRATLIDDGNGSTVRYDYLHDGELAHVTTPAGTLTYSYAGGRVVRITKTGNGPAVFAAYSYDRNGRLTQTRHEDGTIDSVLYDGTGDVVQRTDREGRTYRYTYTPGDLVASVDGPDVHTRYAYDAADRLIGEQSAQFGTRSYQYFDGGRIIAVKDPLGRPALQQFSDDRDVIQAINTAGVLTKYDYDPDGRVAAYTDPLGGVWKYTYDADGNVTQLRAPSGENLVPPVDAQLEGIVSGASYTFNASHQLVRYRDALGTAISATYDPAGRIASISAPGLGASSYRYNAHGFVDAVVSGNQTTSYRYDAAARLAHVRYPNGMVMDRTYAANGQPSSIVYRDARGHVLDYQNYHYNAIGNVIEESGGAGRSTFAYDKMDELTNVVPAEGPAQLFTYDAAGNATSTGSNTQPHYVFNAAHQLIEAGTPGSTITYRYDAQGRLLETTNGKRATRFAYAGNALLGTYDQHGKPVALYVPGAGDGWSATRIGGSSYYPIRNNVGSLIALTDAHGTIVQRFTYDTWGRSSSSGRTIANPAFAGGFTDDSGLIRFGRRFYSPLTHRFLSPDPEGFDAHGNLYAYALNNPLRFIDASGANATLPAGSSGLPSFTFPSAAQVQQGLDNLRTTRGGGPPDTTLQDQIIERLQNLVNDPSPGASRVAQESLSALQGGSELSVRPGPLLPNGTRALAGGGVNPDDPQYAYVYRDGLGQAGYTHADDPVSVAAHEITHTQQDLSGPNQAVNEWEAHYNQMAIDRATGAGDLGELNPEEVRTLIARRYVTNPVAAGKAPGSNIQISDELKQLIKNNQISDYDVGKQIIPDDAVIKSVQKDYFLQQPANTNVAGDVEDQVSKLKSLRAQAEAIEGSGGGGAAGVAQEAGSIESVLADAGSGVRAVAGAAEAEAPGLLGRSASAAGEILGKVGSKAFTFLKKFATPAAALNEILGYKLLIDTAIESGQWLGETAAAMYIGMRNHFLKPFDDLNAKLAAIPQNQKQRQRLARGLGGPFPPGGPDNTFNPQGPPTPTPSPAAVPPVAASTVDPCLVGTWQGTLTVTATARQPLTGILLTITPEGAQTLDYSSSMPAEDPLGGNYELRGVLRATVRASGGSASAALGSSNATQTYHLPPHALGRDVTYPVGISFALGGGSNKTYTVDATTLQYTDQINTFQFKRTSEPPPNGACPSGPSPTPKAQPPANQPQAEPLSGVQSAPIPSPSAEVSAPAQTEPAPATQPQAAVSPPDEGLPPPPPPVTNTAAASAPTVNNPPAPTTETQAAPPVEAPNVPPPPEAPLAAPPAAPPAPPPTPEPQGYRPWWWNSVFGSSTPPDPPMPQITPRDAGSNDTAPTSGGGLWDRVTNALGINVTNKIH